jgi:electron transfer flavoprotein alpha subunit
MDNGAEVLVVAELDVEGRLRAVSWEMLTVARSLAEERGEKVTGLIMGAGVPDDLAEAWGSAGADRVLVASDAAFAGTLPGPAATAIAKATAEVKPAVVLSPGTTAGRDYAPLVAARLGAALAADVVDVHQEGGALVAVRPVLGGRAQSRVTFAPGVLAMATLRPGSFARAAAGATSPSVESLAVDLQPSDQRVELVETTPKGSGSSRLDSAEVVVSGGRGLLKPENFALVEDLATAFGGAVGATRAVVDAGWRPHQEQIGQTGRTVAPKLYFAVGVSGAVQHNVGMQGADYIVAINRDPDAPIFKLASFGIVGDLFEVMPALTQGVRDARG